MEDDILWAEQHDKSSTDFESDEEGDDMMTHKWIQQMFDEESNDASYVRVYIVL